jgi:hypothetical protein
MESDMRKKQAEISFTIAEMIDRKFLRALATKNGSSDLHDEAWRRAIQQAFSDIGEPEPENDEVAQARCELKQRGDQWLDNEYQLYIFSDKSAIALPEKSCGPELPIVFNCITEMASIKKQAAAIAKKAEAAMAKARAKSEVAGG